MNEFLFYIEYYLTSIIAIIIVIFILRRIAKASIKTHHSRWNTLIDNFEFSSKEFYSRLQTELESHGVTNIKIKEVYLKEGGMMSASRLYLRAVWRGYQYDMCAAPFGHGFFISWWLLYKESVLKILIAKIPFLGPWLVQTLFPITYYRIDTASMFMSYAQSSVLKVIDDITNDERKPVLNNIFIR